jgi:lipopolysaccharide export system permease protein
VTGERAPPFHVPIFLVPRRPTPAPLTRFDWHVLRRFASAALLLMVLIALVFVVLDYVEYVDDFLDRGATMGQVFGTYYPHYLFDIVRLTSPLAVFLAAIYVTSRLSQSMQLTALHASGVSLGRFLRPFVLGGLVVTAFMLYFNGWLVPPANAVVVDFQNRYYRDAPEQMGGQETFRQAAPGVVLSAGFFDRAEGRAYRVSLVTTDTTAGRRIGDRLDAAEMTFLDSLGVWRMQTVVERRFAGGAERFTRRPTLDTALALRPSDLAQTERDADKLTIPEARAYVASLRRAGVRDLGRPLVATHAKYAYPVANLLLVLIGVPLAARRRRGGQAVQLGLGLGVAFVYLALQKTVEPLGYVDTIPPAVAVWAPHGVFAAVAAVLLWRARR